MDANAESASRRQIALMRAVWTSVSLVVVALFVASLPARYDELLHPAQESVRVALAHMGLSAQLYAAYNIAFEVAAAGGFFAVALLIFLRRSDDWMASFVSLTLVTFGAALPGTTYALVSGQPIWDIPFGFLQGIGWLFLLIFAYLFPDGRFVPSWTRPLSALWAVWVFGFFWFGHALVGPRVWLFVLSFLIWVAWFGTGAVAQIYRFAVVAGPAQRQQTKWVMLGFLGAICGVLVGVVPGIAPLALHLPFEPGLGYQLAATAVISLTALLIPASIGIAILRHRLYDIDLLINRALVYSTLTAILATLFFGVVIGLQALVGAVNSGSSHSPAIIAASTLGTVALFTPLRHRIQIIIDQRFYRRKYDATKTLEAFGATLRTETDLAQLTEQLVAVVHKTIQPSHVSLWLRPPRQAEERSAPQAPGQVPPDVPGLSSSTEAPTSEPLADRS
jgi:hypothetical protein